MTAPTNAFDAGRLIADAFERHAAPYALGGALAYGQYGIPRATNDVVVNVFVEPDRLDVVFSVLRSVGIAVPHRRARRRSEKA